MSVISLYFQKNNDLIMRKVHCISCGQRLFDVNNRVWAVVNSSGIQLAVLSPEDIVFEHKCRGCNTIYRVYTQ